jgi:hypothetical protein
MKLILSFLFSLIPALVSAENHLNLNVRSIALGRVHAFDSGVVNPSSLSFHQASVLGFSVHNQFQIKGLNNFACYGIFPNRFLDAGLQVLEYGYEDYHRWTVQGSFSKKITSRIALGTSFRYQQFSNFREEEIKPLIHADLGLFFRINEKVAVALLSEDVISNTQDKCQVFIGLNYSIAASCNFLLECVVREQEPLSFSSGIEYELMDHFYFRMGAYSHPLTPTFGLSFSLKPFSVDVACDKHSFLGYSLMLGISYQFKPMKR